ncbi:MAG TPA: histidine phosphatase family protein [Solirubrobacteraceae bacterium]|nr:histidine phosphatase family protein [Solirubrobacteraceae bacterium]
MGGDEHEIWIARHGETEWTLSRQHTSRTDLDLTANGERQARALAAPLSEQTFALVLSSPALRARRTAELAGLGTGLEIDPDLVEYQYGEYEGVTTKEIRESRPDWDLWRDGCPGGENTAQVAARADRVLERLRRAEGAAVVFAHGHISRVLAARFLDLDGTAGRLLVLDTATLSVLGHEHGGPAVCRWNDGCHL